MELSDIQASKGLNRRFFKGVGNSGMEDGAVSGVS